MYKPLILITAIMLQDASCALAQSRSTATDPVLVSPTMYTVLLENEHVRVVEYQIGPGEKDNWHTHPAKASYVVSGGSLRITTEEGESFIVDEEEGSSTWFGTVGRHYGQNVGNTTVRIVFVEIKELDAGQEDLGKYQK